MSSICLWLKVTFVEHSPRDSDAAGDRVSAQESGRLASTLHCPEAVAHTWRSRELSDLPVVHRWFPNQSQDWDGPDSPLWVRPALEATIWCRSSLIFADWRKSNRFKASAGNRSSLAKYPLNFLVRLMPQAL